VSEARDVASTVLDAFRDELVVRLVDLCNVNNFDRLTLLKTYDTINEIYDKHIKKWLYADTVDVAPTQKWISVKERLPDESVDSKIRVLVVLDNGMIDTDRIKNGEWVRWMRHVTHWQPLPQPPKEEGENA
jgi:hypothetical protein